jgi:predicted acyl esterase
VIVDVLLHPFDGPFWRERSARDDRATIPGLSRRLLGHLRAAPARRVQRLGTWKGPKKMVIGPPVYLDRPVYQYHEEALRWFDHWLKDNDTGVMDEPPVRCFIPATGEWKALDDWPPREARWTSFYLHADGTAFRARALARRRHGVVQRVAFRARRGALPDAAARGEHRDSRPGGP